MSIAKWQIEASGKPKTPDRPNRLRHHQAEDYKKNAPKLFSLSNYAVGGGKTLAGIAKAEYWRQRGYDVLIAVPHTVILESFESARYCGMKLPAIRNVAKGTRVVPEIVLKAPWDGSLRHYGRSASDLRDDLIDGDGLRLGGRVFLITHQLLSLLFRILTEDDLRYWEQRNICLVLDEAHRAAYVEGSDPASGDKSAQSTNSLGSTVAWFLDNNKPLVLLSATFFRGDYRSIVPPRYYDELINALYEVPVEEQLGDRKIIMKYVQGPLDKCFDSVLTNNKPTIVYVPWVNSKAMDAFGFKDDGIGRADAKLAKNKAADAVVQAFERAGFPAEKIVNLVDEDIRVGEKKRLKKKDYTAVVSLGLCFEGYDDDRLCRGVIMGSRGSIRQTYQALGRLLRDNPGKDTVEFVVLIPQLGVPSVEDVEERMAALIAGMAMAAYIEGAVPGRHKSPLDINQTLTRVREIEALGGSDADIVKTVADELCDGNRVAAKKLLRYIEDKAARAINPNIGHGHDKKSLVRADFQELSKLVPALGVQKSDYNAIRTWFALIDGSRIEEVRDRLRNRRLTAAERSKVLKLAKSSKYRDKRNRVDCAGIAKETGRNYDTIRGVVLANGMRTKKSKMTDEEEEKAKTILRKAARPLPKRKRS